MSPSQTMNNHSAPSVRLHPPGLVCSLLASVPCRGLAPAVCLPSIFFWAWHAGALSLSGSICLRPCLSFFPPYFFFSLISFFFRLFLSVLLTQAPQSNEQADYVREKREQKKKCSATRGIKGEVIYLPLFWHHD